MANQKPSSWQAPPNNQCIFCGQKLCVNVFTVNRLSIYRVGALVSSGYACYPFCDRVDQEII
jgi:hypothetical protein